MRTLNEEEIAGLNALLDHAERLVNARGQHNGELGVFEDATFEIVIKNDTTGAGVRVARHGVIVLEVRWNVPVAGPGRAFIEPGAWQSELLAIQAAHA